MKKIIWLILLITQLGYAQNSEKHGMCEVDNPEDAGIPFPIHPLIAPDLNEEERANGWSTSTPYGGCPSTCDPGSAFDCCPDMPCEPYQIPVVFTLLADDDCGNIGITTADLDVFVTKVNDYYTCAGIPIELTKCPFWDDAGQMQLADGSTRMICDDDLNKFYRSAANDTPPNDPAGDMTDDFQQVKPFNIPCVMNIYVPGDYNGFTSAGGYISEGGVASFPSGNLSSYGTAFGIQALMNTSADCTMAVPGTASTAIHEIGHWLGLYHTHGPVNNVQVAAGQTNGHVECPDGSECCTKGDLICDTDPDPNLSISSSVQDTGGNTIASCVTGSGCDRDASGCFSTCATPYPANINAEVNIMSYASGSCRFEFTPCQISKMVDGMLCGRSDLACCDPDFADTSDPAPYVTENIITICVGDPAPTFTIDMPGNLNTTCLGWYATPNNTTDFNALVTGLTFTPPTTGTAAINTNVVGNYDYYFDDDLNNYSTKSCDDDVRKMVRVIVEACCVDVVERDDTVADCEDVTTDVTGWKNTVEATDGTGAVNSAPDGAVFEDIIYSTDNMAAIAAANPPAAEPSYVWDAATAGDNCSGITQTVYAYVRCDLNNDGFANPPGTDDTYTLAGTMNLTIHAPPMEPTITLSETCTAGTVGECAYQVNFVCAADIESGTTVNTSTENDGYSGNATESVTIETADGCMETFMIEKPACSCCSATVALANNPTEICDTETMVNICVDVTAGDASEVTIDVNGVTTSGAAGDAQVCVALAVDAFTSCTPNQQMYTVSATCVGGSQILTPTPGTLTVYPTYTTSIVNDMDCGDISISLNYGAMTCGTAMLTCVGSESLNVDFSIPPDPNTNPIDNQFSNPLGCSILTASTLCMGCIICTSTSAIASDNPTEICTGTSATIDICVDVTSGDASEVTIDVDGIMATGAAGATQVCAAIPLNINTGCAPIDQNYTVSAVCNDNSELVPPIPGSITIYPVLTTNVTDDGSTCETLQIDLMDIDGNTCQSATRNCTVDGDVLSVDFGAAPDTDTNPINVQINDPLGCSTLTNATATCSGCPCPPKSSSAGSLNRN